MPTLLFWLFASCANDNSTKSQEDKKLNVYENKEYGYSLVLPEDFSIETEYEDDGGEHVITSFIWGVCKISVDACKVYEEMLSIEEAFKLEKDYYSNFEDHEANIIDSVSYFVKGHCIYENCFENYLSAIYVCRKNGINYKIEFTYPPANKDKFEKDVDEVVKSFKIKKIE